MIQKALTKSMRQFCYDPQTGEPLGNGPKCATCGDLAVWGEHHGCEHKRGCLVVWAHEDQKEEGK